MFCSWPGTQRLFFSFFCGAGLGRSRGASGWGSLVTFLRRVYVGWNPVCLVYFFGKYTYYFFKKKSTSKVWVRFPIVVWWQGSSKCVSLYPCLSLETGRGPRKKGWFDWYRVPVCNEEDLSVAVAEWLTTASSLAISSNKSLWGREGHEAN